jgi:hypothetical protein
MLTRFALLDFFIAAVTITASYSFAPPFTVQCVHAPHNSLTLGGWGKCA